MDEQRHRVREQRDMAEAESFYANATWRMYRRITKYRRDHPLPDCYFHDNDEIIRKETDDHSTAVNDDPKAVTAARSDQSSTDFKGLIEKFVHDDETNATSQNNDTDGEDDEHCMIFELDLS